MLNINTHRTLLIQILKEIYSDSSLGPILGFKGGTAAYLFYELGRFSVDLDFDLLDEKKEDFILEKIEKILINFGTIKEKYNKRHTIFFVISYSKEAHNIKVEINKRSFGSSYEVRNYLGISMLVMKKEDMFAHKLAALLDRKKIANRDIFDIWFFLKNNWDVNEGIIEKRTGLKLNEYLKECISLLEKESDRYILQGIGELLDEKTKVWAKQKLKKDIIFLLKLKLEEIK